MKFWVGYMLIFSMLTGFAAGAWVVRHDQSDELKRLQHFRDHFTCKGEYYYKRPEGGFEYDNFPNTDHHPQ